MKKGVAILYSIAEKARTELRNPRVWPEEVPQDVKDLTHEFDIQLRDFQEKILKLGGIVN